MTYTIYKTLCRESGNKKPNNFLYILICDRKTMFIITICLYSSCVFSYFAYKSILSPHSNNNTLLLMSNRKKDDRKDDGKDDEKDEDHHLFMSNNTILYSNNTQPIGLYTIISSYYYGGYKYGIQQRKTKRLSDSCRNDKTR